MMDLLAFAAVGIGTLAIRAAFVVNPHMAVPARLERVLDHARPAILGALTAGFLARPGTGPSAAGIAGVVVTVLVMRRSRNLLVSLVAGIVVAAAATPFVG